MEFSSGVSSWFNGRGIEITVINKEHDKTFIETIHVRHDLEIPDNTIFVCQEKNIDEYICFLSLKKEVSLCDGTVMYLAELLKNPEKNEVEYRTLQDLIESNDKQGVIHFMNSKQVD